MVSSRGSGGEIGDTTCLPMQNQVISKVSAASDGRDTTCSWRVGPWDLSPLVQEKGENPDLVPVLALLISFFVTLTKTFIFSQDLLFL